MTETEYLRPVRSGDEPAIVSMLEATGLFPPEELGGVMAMLAILLRGNQEGEHRWVLAEGRQQVLGIAYWAPERMTDGTWNLYMLAVHPEAQGRGLGRRIVTHVEQACRAEGVRLLLVETLGIDAFSPQRAFYAGCGYEEDACIRDFYAATMTR